MKLYERYLPLQRYIPFIFLAIVTFLLGLAVSPAHSQDKVRDKIKDKESRSFCSNNNWSGDDDHVSFRELRESTVSAGGTISVDGRQNGGISVKGTNTANEVVVRACIQAWGRSEEAAKASANSIRIVTNGTIHAEGNDDKNWSVSYEILVPRNSNINLTAHNGGISVTGVDGNAEFETMNGGVFLSDVAGNFKGRTTNGGVFVKLTGGSWRGSGLDVITTNGGVNILMPENYAAYVETGTVNGGFNSDIAGLQIPKDERKDGDGGYYYRPRKSRISTDINGGGAPIRIITTNGGVRISSNEKD